MNPSHIDLIRPLWSDYSFVSDENCPQSIKLWLIDGNYYLDDSRPHLSLYCQVADDVRKCLSLDAFRFASHSAQTVFELENTSAYPKFTSWRVIQTYYAAYFAAHAFLRFFGRSFSHLESGHVRFLKNRCESELGYTPNLGSSYYLIDFSPDRKQLNFTKLGESHKDLWKSYLDLLQDLSREALKVRASEARRQELSLIFAQLADALTNRGSLPTGNWLSAVRNDVNYKSEHGVWYPFAKAIPSFETLMSRVKDWRKGSNILDNPNFAKNDLERFFLTAFTVVDLGLSVAFDYRERVKFDGRRSSDFLRLIRASAAA